MLTRGFERFVDVLRRVSGDDVVEVKDFRPLNEILASNNGLNEKYFELENNENQRTIYRENVFDTGVIVAELDFESISRKFPE